MTPHTISAALTNAEAAELAADTDTAAGRRSPLARATRI